MRKLLIASVILGLATAIVVGSGAAEPPKHTIKEVMKEAHRGGLKDKVVAGTASDEEKKHLVELYESLAAGKPPKGEEASWKEKTTALIDAAKEAQAGKGTDNLKAAADCKGCHSVHKG